MSGSVAISPSINARAADVAGLTVPGGVIDGTLDADPNDRPGVLNGSVFAPGGVAYDIRKSPYKTPKDIEIPDESGRAIEPEHQNDAPLGQGLDTLPGGHPWKRGPFSDPSANARYWTALYANIKWMGRFTVDGYVRTDLVDISAAVEVYPEPPGNPTHVAARLSHSKLQGVLNRVGKSDGENPDAQLRADQMPIVVTGPDRFFNDLDDLQMELRPATPQNSAPVSGPGGKSSNPRGDAERELGNSKPKKIPVRYVWPKKTNPLPKNDRSYPKNPPTPPKSYD